MAARDTQRDRDFHNLAIATSNVAKELRTMNTYLAGINQNLVIIGALMAEAGKDEKEQENPDASS